MNPTRTLIAIGVILIFILLLVAIVLDDSASLAAKLALAAVDVGFLFGGEAAAYVDLDFE